MKLAILWLLPALAVLAQTTGAEWYSRGLALDAENKPAAAIEAFEKALALQARPIMAQVKIAANQITLGHRDQAFDILDRVAATGFGMVSVLDGEPRFAAVAKEERYQRARRRIEGNGSPCTSPEHPEYRQFDFWIGEWQVTDRASGTPVGTSSVQLILNNCVIYENWTATNKTEGKSFNKYNPLAKQWEQYWVDGSPGRMFFTGHLEGNEMRLSSDTPRRHLTFFNQPNGTVRQFSEISNDGGKTFTVEYDFLYKKVSASH